MQSKIYFKSKIKELYNIDESIITYNEKFLQKSKHYLNNHYYDGKSYMDMCHSPIHKPKKYCSELQNRVTAQIGYAKQMGFKTPIFFTVTVPSEMKPTRVIPNKTKSGKTIVDDNPRFDGNMDTYIQDCNEWLSYKWRAFLQYKVFTKIKNKYKKRAIYISTKEPSLDGTPHQHILMFVPDEFIQEVCKAFYKHYGLRAGIYFKVLSDYKQAKAYILKYILKSFKQYDNGKYDLITHWFVFNKIRRFSSSRGIIPLFIYRKIGYDNRFRDMFYCTQLRDKGLLFYCEIPSYSEGCLKDGKLFLYGNKTLSCEIYFSEYKITNLDDPNLHILWSKYQKVS